MKKIAFSIMLLSVPLAFAMRSDVHAQESRFENPMEESDSEDLDLDRLQAWVGTQMQGLRELRDWVEETEHCARRSDTTPEVYGQLARRGERLRARLEHDSRGGKDDVEEQQLGSSCGNESQEQVHMELCSTQEHSRNNTQGEPENVSALLRELTSVRQRLAELVRKYARCRETGVDTDGTTVDVQHLACNIRSMHNQAYDLEKKIRKIQPDAGPLVDHQHTRTVHTRTTKSSHFTQQHHHTPETNSTSRSHNQQSAQQNQQGAQNNTLRSANSQSVASQSPATYSNQDDNSQKNTKDNASKKNDASNSCAYKNTDASWSPETQISVAGLAVIGVVAIVKFLPTVINKFQKCWYNGDSNKKVISEVKAHIKDDGIDVDAE